MDQLKKAVVPGAVLEVLSRLEDEGHEAYIVGGVVRDLLLGREDPARDWDLATRATPEEVQGIFKKVIPTGIEHGTVTVLLRGPTGEDGEVGERLGVEVTTYRGEAEYTDGRRPDAVRFLDRIEDDLARRDFTVNALAWNPLRGELKDPFGGRSDLEARCLRAVGDPVQRFGEDGLRPLRAVRFAAVLGFEIEAATLAAIPGSLPIYDRVAVERLAQELKKLLLGAQVDRGLELLARTGLWRRLTPEGSEALYQGREALRRLPALELPRWGGFLAPAPSAVAGNTLEQLKLSRVLQRQVGSLLEVHGQGLPAPQDGPGLRRRLADLARAGAGLEGRCEALAALYEALGGTEGPAAAAAIRQMLAAHPPLTPSELALGGREVMEKLGLKGGPEIGDAVQDLLEWVLEDPARNTVEALSLRLASRPPITNPTGKTK